MSLRWSAEKEMIFAVESLALGGVPGSARPTTARTTNPIPVAASNFLPFASATATFPPPLMVTGDRRAVAGRRRSDTRTAIHLRPVWERRRAWAILLAVPHAPLA